MAERCGCRAASDPSRLTRDCDGRARDHRAPAARLAPPCGACEARQCPPSVFGPPGGVPFFLRQILLICTVFYSVSIPSALASVHNIKWDPRNPIFRSENDTILRVQEDDKIRFTCGSRSSVTALYWSSKRQDFDQCVGQYSLFTCNTSDSFEVHVTEFQWLPGLPSFNKGKPIYFIARPYMCEWLGVRIIAVFDDRPPPSKTTQPRPRTTAMAQRPRTEFHYVTKTEYVPKTSAKVQQRPTASTTRTPKSKPMKKSVPMLKTSRAGYASMARAQADHWATVELTIVLSLLHHLALR